MLTIYNVYVALGGDESMACSDWHDAEYVACTENPTYEFKISFLYNKLSSYFECPTYLKLS